MSFTGKMKKPMPDDNISNNTTKTTVTEPKYNESEPSTSYEVFRNNTTAVEVIVKEVNNKDRKKTSKGSNDNIRIVRVLRKEIDNLQYQLAVSHSMLAKNKKAYGQIVLEIKKQLDAVNKQELETQKENLALLMENEKLKTLLDLKTRVIAKFKKEMNTMKRILKCVIKNITYSPQLNEASVMSPDQEYEEFNSDLKKDIRVKFVSNSFDTTGMTFESTLSQDIKESFDKNF